MDATHQQEPHEQRGDAADRAAEASAHDPLLAIRAELDDVAQLPIDERAEVFERTHRIVVDELRALELS